MPGTRRHVVTIRDPVAPYDELFKLDKEFVRYAVWQVERAVNGGHLQAQCYVEFTKQRLLRTVHGIFGEKSCVQAATGTKIQNYDYCTKTNNAIEGPWEIGTRIIKKKRVFRAKRVPLKIGSLKSKAIATCSSDVTLEEVYEKYPQIRDRFVSDSGVQYLKGQVFSSRPYISSDNENVETFDLNDMIGQ